MEPERPTPAGSSSCGPANVLPDSECERARRGSVGAAGVGAGILALIGCGEPDMEPMVGVELRRPMSVGVLEGDSLRTFGRIADVSVATDGSFAVLDAEARDVRWFDLDGAFRGRISRRGEGPGELGRPNSMTWTRSGELLILDSGNHRVSAFAPHPDGLEHLSDWSGEAWGTMGLGRELCEVQGRLYLRRFDMNGRVLHEVDVDEGVVHSFESAVPVPEDIVAGRMERIAAPQMNFGVIACVEDPPMVLSMGGYSLMVRAFDPDGELLWETRPEGLVERTWHLGSDGLPGHRAGDEDNPTHYGQSIVRWGPEGVLAQFSTYPAPALVSVELDLRTGVERGRSADLPLFIAGTAERVWALEREPFPKLTVYEVAPVDEGR